MRNEPDDRWDTKEVERLNAEPWQMELLKLNPSYCSWGPGEDYMITKGDGWNSELIASSWPTFQLRELDDLNEVANFYFSVERTSKKCEACDGGGYATKAKRLSDDFYDFAETGRRWRDKITLDEVEALVEGGQLRSKWDENTRQWLRPERVDETFVAAVNAANSPGGAAFGGMSHDAINQGILIRARCKRLGYELTCSTCDGQGDVYTAPSAHVELTLWLLHPRKGASRGVRIERVEQADLPEIFAFLRSAAERNAARFGKLPPAAEAAQ